MPTKVNIPGVMGVLYPELALARSDGTPKTVPTFANLRNPEPFALMAGARCWNQ